MTEFIPNEYKNLAAVVRVPQFAQNLVILRFDLLRTAKKCSKIYNARAHLLFCSLNLLSGGVLVTVVIVVCLSSLN